MEDSWCRDVFQLEGASLQLWLGTQWGVSVSSSSRIVDEPRAWRGQKKNPFWPAGPLLLPQPPPPSAPSTLLSSFLSFSSLISDYSSPSFSSSLYLLLFLLAPPLSSLIYDCSSSLLQFKLPPLPADSHPSFPSPPRPPTPSLPHHNHSPSSSNSFSSSLQPVFLLLILITPLPPPPLVFLLSFLIVLSCALWSSRSLPQKLLLVNQQRLRHLFAFSPSICSSSLG